MRVRKTIWIILLIFSSFSTAFAEDLYLLGLRAEAYSNVHDFEQSRTLYESLLNKTLPEWQKAIVLYDLATIYLKLNQQDKAQSYFTQIQKEVLSSPWLLKDLELNEGINLMMQAIEQSSHSIDSPYDLVSLIRSGLQHLETEETLACFIQRLEKVGVPLELCEKTTIARDPMKEGHRLLNQLVVKQLEDFGHNETNAIALITEGMQQLSPFLQTQENLKNYNEYMIYQLESLLPLWSRLKTDSYQPLKKLFQALIDQLKEGNFSSLDSNLGTLLDQLKEKNKISPLQSLILHSQLILYNGNKSKSSLESLLAIYKKIDVEENQKLLIKEFGENLGNSLRYIDRQKKVSYFYLAAALNDVVEIRDTDQEDDPITLLENALKISRSVGELTYRYDEISREERQDKMSILLLKAQDKIIRTISPFIASVHRQEKEWFSKKDAQSACQKSPWDQAIPLYDKGVKAALGAKYFLTLHPPNTEKAAGLQTKTIQKWEEVLQLLKNPPRLENQSPEQNNSNPHPIKEAPANLDETLQLIQEMQLEDQPQQWSMPKEFETW